MKVVPFNKRPTKNMKKSFARTSADVKPVAKDTNKTRRKQTLLPLKNAVMKKRKP